MRCVYGAPSVSIDRSKRREELEKIITAIRVKREAEEAFMDSMLWLIDQMEGKDD